MAIQLVHFSNCGPVRQINQDAYCIRICSGKMGPAFMIAVCDGMGGMNCGEVASASVISAFESWFDTSGIDRLRNGTISAESISSDWNQIVKQAHQKLQAYGADNGLRVGTTLSVILAVGTTYYLLHVGDTRIYLENGTELKQLTKDQTLAMRELEAGRISEEEFQSDSRRNVLLQCVGYHAVSPSFYTGQIPIQGGILACSDGFYHTVSEQELHEVLRKNCGKQEFQQYLVGLVERGRTIGETDNITCVALRWDIRQSDTTPTQRMDSAADSEEVDPLAKISFMNTNLIV